MSGWCSDTGSVRRRTRSSIEMTLKAPQSIGIGIGRRVGAFANRPSRASKSQPCDFIWTTRGREAPLTYFKYVVVKTLLTRVSTETNECRGLASGRSSDNHHRARSPTANIFPRPLDLGECRSTWTLKNKLDQHTLHSCKCAASQPRSRRPSALHLQTHCAATLCYQLYGPRHVCRSHHNPVFNPCGFTCGHY